MIADLSQFFQRTLRLLTSLIVVGVVSLAVLATAVAGEAPVVLPPPVPSPPTNPVVSIPPSGIIGAAKDYTLYQGDLLKIEVFDHPDLTSTDRKSVV